jgi:hypothetical protein
MQISTETSAWLLQARDFLYEARRLKPGPERNDLRQTAKVLREIARLERIGHPAGLAAGNRIGRRIRCLMGFPECRSGKSRCGRPSGCAANALTGTARFDSWNAPVFGRARARIGPECIAKHLLDFEMHDVVAFARCRREPRRVDLDQAPSIGPDRATRAQLAHQERHGRTSHTEYLRERLLGEREHIMVDAVAKLEQPARHARFDRVQRVAGRTELKLLQHRPDVNLDRVPYRRAPVESGVKSRCGYPAAVPAARTTAVLSADDGPSTERIPTAPSRPTAAMATVCPSAMSIISEMAPL